MHRTKTFPAQPSQELESDHRKMDKPRFIIEAPEAESMAKNSGLSLLHLLPTLVQSAQTLARPPISRFPVAAVGLSSDGRIFVGVNLEFAGVPLHHSVHAEQFLLTSLAVHGAGDLLSVAVSAAPCGHCRQFFQELRRASDLQICITSENPGNFKPLSSFLIDPFGPFDLLDRQTPLLLEPHRNGLILKTQPTSKIPNICNGDSKSVSDFEQNIEGGAKEAMKISNLCYGDSKPSIDLRNNLCNGNSKSEANFENGFRITAIEETKNPNVCHEISKSINGSENYSAIAALEAAKSPNLSRENLKSEADAENSLTAAALEAANESHAPYSGCPSGVALMDCKGGIYKGSYMESAAYNPSLGPVQAAVVAYVAAGGGGGYEGIVAGCLVEREGAPVGQEETARMLLKIISPKCKFRVFHCVEFL